MAICGIFTDGLLLNYLGKGLCYTNILSAAIRIKRRGFENVDPNKQYIIMMNHVNLFDPFVLTSTYPGHALAFQEVDHFRWPLYGWIMKKLKHIPIDRSNARQALRDLKKGIEVLKTRKEFSLIIFPEGTRCDTGKLGEMKKGAFYLALDSGVEILPIVQIGAYEVKKKNKWLVTPFRKMEVIIEKPISLENYNKRNVHELMERTRQVFLKYVE